MSDKNEIQTAIEAGTALARTLEINGTPIILVPEGYSAEEHAHLLAAPTRHKGKAELLDAASFIAYVNAFKSGPNLPTRLYYKIDPKPQFVAVFNDHTADGPAFRDFTAEYNAPLSKEWQEWLSFNGRKMKQEEFALFIERNVLDVTAPPSADILEIVSTLQSTKGVNFASGIRLDNGQTQLKYEETVTAKAGEKGQFSVPDRIEITIPVFDGSTVADRLTAKFRYRIDGGSLIMWYDLERPHKVLEVAVADLHKQIAEGTSLHAFKGEPA
ncbi:YfdQ family protein [Caballeronia sp. SEWSISQ10-4 2]|uniref:DUF2303 family protein n=1 Tax=Caballeronia sp. SEWSISQ10-4 2 TaxID=2937438 RepID=UPI00264A957B|nr:DUF2303 family protein [Caballeronia sp. SEWSISQ10-4 2]MDN7179062.1 YfdQ family protein [Caballeronia sp. SEWSISQ10-4 2]